MFKSFELRMPNAQFREDAMKVISEIKGFSWSVGDAERLIGIVKFLTEMLIVTSNKPYRYLPEREQTRLSWSSEYQVIMQVMDGLYGASYNREATTFIIGTVLWLSPVEAENVFNCNKGIRESQISLRPIYELRKFLYRTESLLKEQMYGRLGRPAQSQVQIYEIGNGDQRRARALKSAKEFMKRGEGVPVDDFAGETADPFFGILDINSIKNKYEYWYLNLLRRLTSGRAKEDRTGTGTCSETFETYKHDLREGFPALRSRFLKPENPGKELKWMLSGSDNEKDLAAMGVPFWSEFADETGNLGPVYGFLWRHWPNGDGTETDQVRYVQDLLRTNPTSRRMVVDCWHPTFIPNSKNAPKDNYKEGKQALTPCHILWDVVVQPMSLKERMDWLKVNRPNLQLNLLPVCENWEVVAAEKMDGFGVPKYFLDLGFVMRSTDTVLGLPANMNFYATLAHALAKENNMVARYLGYVGMDVHVYKNHIDGINQQFEYVRNNPDKVFGEVTTFHIEGDLKDVVDIDVEKFRYENYSRELVGPAIRFPIAI